MYKLTISEIDPSTNQRTENVINFAGSYDAWMGALSLTEPDDYGRGYLYAMADHRLTGTVHCDPLCRVSATVTLA